jgi:5-formyltetrahydrofolate cyclo-ligase
MSEGVYSDSREWKRHLRREARQWLKSQAPEALAAASTEICRRIQASAEFEKAGRILLFFPRWDEPDVRPLLQAALRQGKQVCLPVFDETVDEYRLAPLDSDSPEALVEGQYGIPEPAVSMNNIDVKSLDFGLIPGLVFSRDAVRLGRGKGYFDRLLRGFTGVRAGVCFDGQVVEAAPVEAHDIPMDLVWTEAGRYEPCSGLTGV